MPTPIVSLFAAGEDQNAEAAYGKAAKRLLEKAAPYGGSVRIVNHSTTTRTIVASTLHLSDFKESTGPVDLIVVTLLAHVVGAKADPERPDEQHGKQGR